MSTAGCRPSQSCLLSTSSARITSPPSPAAEARLPVTVYRHHPRNILLFYFFLYSFFLDRVPLPSFTKQNGSRKKREKLKRNVIKLNCD